MDPMTRLKAADPARALGSVDAATLAALREEITMTGTAHDTTTASPPLPVRRRLRRRAAVALGVVGVLAGGGVAYATGLLDGFLGGNVQGPNCLTVWGEPSEADGPWLTGDAIADCATIRSGVGLAPIDDPVAFRYEGFVYVTPAGQVPDGVEVLASPVILEPAVTELQASARDVVDGGQSVCRTPEEMESWVRSELDRLGLDGWSVVHADPALVDDGVDRPCAEVSVDETPGVARVFPVTAAAVDSADDRLATTLRAEVAGECLSLDDARAVVDRVLEEQLDFEPFPTTALPDEQADCTRIDLQIGGSVQVTLHGPITVRQ